MELEIEFQFLRESIPRTFPFFFFFTKISIVTFGNFCAIFHWRRRCTIFSTTKAEIKLKTDRRFGAGVDERRKQGINRAKTFWPENRSRGELESCTAGIERYGVVFGNKQFELVFHPLSCSRP